MFDERGYRVHAGRRHSYRAGAFRRTGWRNAVLPSIAASKDYGRTRPLTLENFGGSAAALPTTCLLKLTG